MLKIKILQSTSKTILSKQVPPLSRSMCKKVIDMLLGPHVVSDERTYVLRSKEWTVVTVVHASTNVHRTQNKHIIILGKKSNPIIPFHVGIFSFSECSEPFEDVYLQFGTSEGRGSKDPYHADNQGYNERLLAQSVKNRNRNRRLKPQGRGYSKNGNENYYNGQNEYRNTQNDNQGDNHIDKDTNYGQHGPISRNYGGYHNTRGNGPRKRVINPENLQIMYNMLSHLLQNLPASRNNQGNNRGGLCPLMGKLCLIIR